MIKFYRATFLVAALLLSLTAFSVFIGLEFAHFADNLYPSPKPELHWRRSVEPRVPTGINQLKVKEEHDSIDYTFLLDPDLEFPYTHYALYFGNEDELYAQVDLTPYDRISFGIQCQPENIMNLVMFSFDEDVTDIKNPNTRRVSSAPFTCADTPQEVTLLFSDFITPEWWLDRYHQKYTDTGFALNRSMGFGFINSQQSPVGIKSRVVITDIKLEGRRPYLVKIIALLCLIAWCLGGVWVVRNYIRVLTESLKERLLRDRPLMAYKQLTIEPQKAREKDILMRHMATQYNDPELSLEATAVTLGINRTKINGILREELGYTFTSYLNKLRLTEAARLLSEKKEMTISEIAYTVGYNSVTYFNKLFKQEYGCTPKRFKDYSSST